MFDLRKLLGIKQAPQMGKQASQGAAMGAMQAAKPMMQRAQAMPYMLRGGGTTFQNPNQLHVGQGMQVQGTEGVAPQDQSFQGLDMNNYLQPSYQNPQTSLHGGFQQNQGINGFGNPTSPQVQPTSDPTGWLRRQIRY